MSGLTAFPLCWPPGWRRSEDGFRGYGRFGVKRESKYSNNYRHKQAITVAEAVMRIRESLRQMGIDEQDVIISTNVKTRLDGLPRSGEPEPKDPGAAVYWQDAFNNRRCMAIDQYTEVAQNLAAIAATLEAMRAIERHGGAEILDRAFTGFVALAAPTERDWAVVLQIAGLIKPTVDDITKAYRRLASEYHPDRGGDPAKMAELNRARDAAMKEIGA